jgi:hypothetical protein
MALQSSGAISLNEIHIEAGGSTGSNCTINDSDIRGLISKSSGATMAFNEWYGASNNELVVVFTYASQSGKFPHYGFRNGILGSTTDRTITVNGTSYDVYYCDATNFPAQTSRLLFGTSTDTTETPFGTSSDTSWDVTRSGGGLSNLTANVMYDNSPEKYYFSDDEIVRSTGTHTLTFSN